MTCRLRVQAIQKLVPPKSRRHPLVPAPGCCNFVPTELLLFASPCRMGPGSVNLLRRSLTSSKGGLDETVRFCDP